MDPQLVAVDFGAPFTRFDGTHGSLMPDAGWAPVENPGNPFSWAIDGAGSTFLVERPPAKDLDLLALCRPFSFPGAKRQVLSVYRGDDLLARAPLDHGKGWQTVRLELPQGSLEEGVNRLTLRFRYARRPAVVTEDNRDKRRLSAAFKVLAVLPRRLEDLDVVTTAAALYDEGLLHLADGMATTLPVPGGTTAELRLGDVESGCSDCTIRIDILARDGSGRHLWSGRAGSAAGSTLVLPIPGSGVGRIRMSIGPGQPSGFARDRKVTFRLAEGFLRTRITSDRSQRRVRPNVFIYLVDTLRADALQLYGGDLETSPEIDRFAADGVTYSNAWSASSWTLPSVVSMLTGLYPGNHGIMTGLQKLAGGEIPLLGPILAANGHATVAISQSMVSSHQFGFDRGFEEFYYNDQLNGWLLRSQEVRRRLLDWLVHRIDPERPVFAFLHTVDPHGPYRAPKEFREFADLSLGRLKWRQYKPWTFVSRAFGEDPGEVAHMHGLYHGEVAHADHEFGRFLDMLEYLGLYDDSLIILVSDHGEEFREHGGFEHGRTLYEELVRVPLIVKYPRSLRAGETVRERVNLVDIMPTVLDVVGVDRSGLRQDGRSLLGVMPEDRVVWSEVRPLKSKHYSAVDYRAIAVGGIKCIENLAGNDRFGKDEPRWQVFDLERDPGEQRPLDESSQEGELCRSLLGQFASRLSGEIRPSAAATDESTLEKLRALGYID